MVEKSRLNPSDIKKLLSDPSEHTRADVARKVAAEVDSHRLTDEERNIANGILQIMVKDAAALVRRSLSESLRHSENVSRDVALALARDIENVALPIIQSSPVFTDEDLAEIINAGDAAKQVAIAGRPVVSDCISRMLVETRNEAAVEVLAANDGADMSPKTYQAMIDIFPKNARIHEALVHRRELPSQVVERLISMVSGELKKYLMQCHEMDARDAAALTDDVRERATVDLIEQAAEAEEIENFVNHLYGNERLTPSIIVRAICTGDIRFFEATMAKLAHVPLKNAQAMIHDSGSLGLRALFMRTSIPKIYYPIFRVAVDVLHETDYDGGAGDRTRFRRRIIERVLTQFSDIQPDDIDYLIKVLEGGTFSTIAA